MMIPCSCFWNPLGEKLSPEELQIMIKEADLDGDNEISITGTIYQSLAFL